MFGISITLYKSRGRMNVVTKAVKLLEEVIDKLSIAFDIYWLLLTIW